MADKNEFPLTIMIMHAILKTIIKSVDGLETEDPTRLRLIEVRPRDEGFADVGLSCSLSHNDPDDPESWNDEETAAPGTQYNYYSGKRHLEMDGGGQPMNTRFTVTFRLYFQEIGILGDEAIEAAEVIISRIHRAIIVEGERQNGIFSSLYKGDIYGHKVINARRAVKRLRVIVRGSDEETFAQAKIWLQFTTLYEV